MTCAAQAIDIKISGIGIVLIPTPDIICIVSKLETLLRAYGHIQPEARGLRCGVQRFIIHKGIRDLHGSTSEAITVFNLTVLAGRIIVKFLVAVCLRGRAGCEGEDHHGAERQSINSFHRFLSSFLS